MLTCIFIIVMSQSTEIMFQMIAISSWVFYQMQILKIVLTVLLCSKHNDVFKKKTCAQVYTIEWHIPMLGCLKIRLMDRLTDYKVILAAVTGKNTISLQCQHQVPPLGCAILCKIFLIIFFFTRFYYN